MIRSNNNHNNLKRAVLKKKIKQQLQAQKHQKRPPIKSAPRDTPLPLSFAQQRLWFLNQLDPAASLAYHIPAALRLTGQLNRDALNNTLNRLIARHENLRTRFILIEGQPCQYIDPADIGLALAYQDLRPLDTEQHATRIAEVTELEAQTPFDLTQGPLIRGQLLQLADEEHILLLTQHHIISDGWSIGVLVHELEVLYRAERDHVDALLPTLPIQYADYAVWQREWLQGEVLAQQRDFWHSQLEGAPSLLTLPTDRPRPAVQTYTGHRLSVQFDPDLLASLKSIGQHHNTTLFMVVLTAWSVVLARLSGQEEVVIGTPIANRPHKELEGLMGFFVNTLALRVTLSDNPSVADLLTQVRERALAAYAHQDLPFEQVVETLQPERSLSHSPIFQVMLALNNTPPKTLTLPDLQLTPIELVRHSAHFDMTLSLTETESGLLGELEYVVDLFDAATIERMIGYLKQVLVAMANDATQRVDQLPLLSAAERQQILVDFNATQVDFPQGALIHQLFEAQATQQPEATAAVFGEQTLSYGELNHRANQLAHHLIALGVRPDDRVAICVERSLELIVGLLAILKAGGTYVPLDPSYPAERLAYMLEDATPVLLLTQAAQRDKLAVSLPTVLLDHLLDDQDPLFAAQPADNPDAQALGLTARHLAYVIYTSGSTGQPKGVMIEHRSLCNLTTTQQNTLALTPDSRVLQFASNSFDACIWECAMAFVAGARLYLAKRADLLPGEILSGYLAAHAISHVLLSPTALAAMDALPDTLHTLLVGGEACPPTLVKRWAQGRQMLNAYGPTEITVCATLYPCDRQKEKTPPIGRPIANTRIYILDGHGQPVPIGVSGEIYIAGAGVARGYLNRPTLTAERFLRDPFSADPDARMYKTGDLGRWLPDGNIAYLGRNDFQVKLRGFRIELGEIESQLMQCHGVREAVVIAREDEPAQKRLVAYLRPQEGVELVPAELRQQLTQHLTDSMLPSAFVMLDAFPLTPNGKLDRQALPAPDASAAVTRHYEAPVGEVEIALAQIWQELLGLEKVGRHDHFFELGGHSLLIVSLMDRLHKLGWRLEVRSVFDAPILRALAQTLLSPQNAPPAFAVPPNLIPADCTAITPDMLPLVSLTHTEIATLTAVIPGGGGNVQDIYPLAPLQEGIFFQHLLQAQGDDYLLRSLFAFDRREQLNAFLTALQQIIDRHDILRTSVHWQGLSQPVQVVWRQAILPVNIFTPAPDTGEDVVAQLRAATDPCHHRLDLRQAPLFAADIAHDPRHNEWLLALRFHHLVSDHMTLELIFAEMAQVLRGNAETLPAALPYRNFVAQALSVSAAEHEAYFRTQLADIEEPTAPFGLLEIPRNNDVINEETLLLAPALANAIRAQSRRLGVSPSVLFHVAWAQVLAHTSGHDDVVFGTVLLGRLQGVTGADRILGMFINTLPIRIALADLSVQAVVQATYQNLTTLLEHEQAPLALAQQCSGVAAPLPLFSTLLNYRHSHVSETNTEAVDDDIGRGMRFLTAEERTNFPITLSVDDLGAEGFQLTAQTVAEADPTRIIRYLVTALHSLMEALIQHPQQPILSLSVLPAAERQQVLMDFNATQADFPQNALIHQLVEAQAAQHPDATALIFEEQTLNYGELNRRANQLAHHLIALGVRPDDRIAICAERSLELIVGLLAILKAGGAYLPLDPTYPAERLAYMLDDAAPVVLLTQTGQRDKLSGTLLTVLLDHLLDDQDPRLAAQPADNPDAQALGLTARHLAYVIYTSGSTGQPKGVMVEHRNVLRLLINNGFADITPNDCLAHCANISFDAATWEVWSGLVHGARILLIPEKILLQPDDFGRCLSAQGISALFLTSALFNHYAHLIGPSLAGLRYVLFGGEQTDTRPAISLRAEYPPQYLLHVYGPTETTTFATAYVIPEAEDKDGRQDIPIGRPISNTQIYLLDKHGQPVPLGVAGEIYIGGAGVARGYLNRPELTAERFLRDPFSADTQARMYKTGDLGRWQPDGNIEYLGRNDFQVKLRGFRIELGEIEARLMQCHGVREAVVLVREDATGQKHLVAYLRPQEGIELLPAELRQQLAQHLADYMLPSAFVMLDAFPLTPNGKLDRQALPAPDGSAVITRHYEAPVGEVEIALAQIWQDLLGLEHVGRHDHFFELGGHSLLIVSLMERLHKLGWRLEVRSVFDAPILRALAQTLLSPENAPPAFAVPPNLIPADCTVITPDMLPLVSLTHTEIATLSAVIPGGAGNVQDIYPLAPLQEGILFHHLLQTQGDDYLLRSLFAFDRREQLNAFLTALQHIIDRHDILRTSVHWQGLSQPVQVVWRQATLPVKVFTPIPDTEEDVVAQLRAATDPRHHRLDLRQAPLFAADIAHDPQPNEWLLALRFHHLVSDHLAMELIFTEMAQILLGHADTLPAALPYRDFVAQTLSVPVAEHAAYFRTQLADIEEPTAPFGLLEIPRDDNAISEAHQLLEPALASAIRTQARRSGVSASVLFHVAWAQVLAKTSGRDDVVFGSVLLGRLQGVAGADRILGMFINTLPVRIALAGLSAQAVVQATYHNLTTLLEHEQAPLALAQQCSGVAAPLPLFTTLLNYRHSHVSEADPVNDEIWRGMRLLTAEERTNFPITLAVDDMGADFRLAAQTATGADPARLTRYLVTALHELVEALIQQPQQPILSLPVLPAAERRQILVDFNATQANFPQDALIHQRFEAQAAQRPDATAIVFEGQALSYGELNRRANQLAHHLIALGVRPDDRVAICVERSLGMVVGLLAILKAGGAYVPLDPAYPAERLAYMLDDAAPVALLTQATLHDELRDKLDSTLPTVLLDNTPESHGSFWATLP
ncbi:non-ribosomal peptide synthetase, partial [Xenorhabdus sp. IM139775]|uniref:non-ribosomal peptide synthetase n=1 Tax=Xenorhabdus sp. IM139775 TaxID=3025876 RepID=UPI0023586C28